MKPVIAVLFGGCSSEYAVSLQSAHGVLTHWNADRWQAVPVGITHEGRWYLYRGPLDALPQDTWADDPAQLTPAVISPDRAAHGLLLADGSVLRLDAVLPILHGINGEDGTVQGLCELAGIPVAGCGCLAGALGMDKYRAHLLARQAGVAVPRGFIFTGHDAADTVADTARTLGYPLFVKPLRAGSSYGISCVHKPEELAAACCEALRYDSEILLEEAITGVEVGCAVLGNAATGLTLGVPDEVELPAANADFFDYHEKYTLESSKIHVPARLSPALTEAVKQAAAAVYKVLGCTGFARVDMFVTPEVKIYFNEVNTIPGFTAHSRYPAMMQAAGLSFEAVLDTIVEGALDHA